MNWANRITLFRIILLPAIVVLMMLHDFNGSVPSFFGVWNQTIGAGNYQLPVAYLVAGILFILASLSDALDGYIARKHHLVTTFGKFFDAIADKLLTNSVLVMFTIANIIPAWICIILICRDFLIDVVRQVLAKANVVMAANKLGKYRAAFEMLGLTILFFLGSQMFDGTAQMYGEYGWLNQIVMIPMYIATVLSIISAANYIYLNRKTLLDTGLEKTTVKDKAKNLKIQKLK
ncbi:CDP-diacylglycerol-glycerol-3-phosphate 3-phosphatidyltransferase [Spiroplasma clarkii]|uniref:CDP-diacylglycerol--glycerol-3-phosphate 3-phosphatidyltransferase n=1 Tax=Spiroplasma clarkii TaxID=2139 RepID=UPI000B571E4D|nr:CDP-diacylglycerol--glycerol-3-phosphate 3-phosphatidyltransferase [Spiroplasma clarkii]ARU91171.1 CDP-diacylglycerol-glycerol-3-phosphate 3-phosphatidyltransferase [Spiroplasma clarkii]